MKNIILGVSLLLNVWLYFGYIDSVEYKRLIDSWFTTGQNIVNNQQVQQAWSAIKTEITKGVGAEVKNTVNNIATKK